jgi:hypothetical protein
LRNTHIKNLIIPIPPFKKKKKEKKDNKNISRRNKIPQISTSEGTDSVARGRKAGKKKPKQALKSKAKTRYLYG